MKLDAPAKSVGDNIQAAKKLQAHVYMSSYAQVDQALKTIQALDAKLTLDTLLVRAAAKALNKTFKQQGVTVVHVNSAKAHSIITNAERLNLLQIKGAEQAMQGATFVNGNGVVHVEMHNVKNSVEALPITNPNTMITLHYTSPQQDVVPVDIEYYDISVLGDKPASYDLKIKPANRVKLSISFDASRVDELQAVKFLSKVQTYLNDTDSML